MRKAIIALFIIALSFTPAYSHDDHEHFSEHGHTAGQCLMAKFKLESGGFLLRFKDELQLTDAQQKQLLKMSKDLCTRLHDRKEEIKAERDKINELLRRKDLDISALRIQLKKVYDLEYNFKIEALAEFQKAREILTPEQKDKLPEILSHHIK